MGFWETAGAAFVGGLGLAVVIGLGRLIRHLLWARSTGTGRYMTEFMRQVDKNAGELARELRQNRD
jgi:hypothetical protein